MREISIEFRVTDDCDEDELVNVLSTNAEELYVVGVRSVGTVGHCERMKQQEPTTSENQEIPKGN